MTYTDQLGNHLNGTESEQGYPKRRKFLAQSIRISESISYEIFETWFWKSQIFKLPCCSHTFSRRKLGALDEIEFFL